MENTSSTCVNHRDRPATQRCTACHKPLCEECALNAGDLVYCSQTCTDNAAKFAARYTDKEEDFLARADGEQKRVPDAEFQRLIAQFSSRAGSKKERQSGVLAPPVQQTSWAPIVLAFLIGLGVAVFFYSRQNQSQSQSQPGMLEKAAEVAGRVAANTPPQSTPTSKKSGERDDPPVVALALPVEEKAPGVPEPPPQAPPPIVGARIPLGNLAVEVQDYYVEKDPPKGVAFSGLSVCLANNGAVAMVLPQVEIRLLDGERREYAPFKAQIKGSSTLNPLMQVKSLSAFQVPAAVQVCWAQFKVKEGKETRTICIGLDQRTPENQKLVEAEDYGDKAMELVRFANPRFELCQQYAKELANMDPILADLDACRKTVDKTERHLKPADGDLAKAKADQGKKQDAVKADDKYLKEVQANKPDFIHQEPFWRKQVNDAQNRLDRATRDAESADKALKEKQEKRNALVKQEAEDQKRFTALKSKFDAQRRILEDLEKKIDDVDKKMEEQR